MTTSAANVLRTTGLVAMFLFTVGGTPTNGTPTNGTPTNGTPTNGTPTNGTPTNGTPTNGAGLDLLESSLVFANKAVHEALISQPFTRANLTNPNSPLYQIWFDPFSALFVSYLWQDAHAMGDDLTFFEPRVGKTFRFYGNLGLCDHGGTGWARNTPLDETCARWVSASIIAQVNQSGVHNLFSARGPTSHAGLPGVIGPQLTDMSPAMHSFEYKFGTHDPVEALHDPCPDGTSGPENCGWQPGLVGTGTAGALVKVSLSSGGLPMLAQANQGIMGHNYPWASKGSCFQATGCTDTDVLGVDASGTLNPSVQFTIPSSGVFNVQWTMAARSDLATGVKPVMTAQVISAAGTVRFPANELDVFPSTNREMTASGNIFGQANIDPGLWKCEARLVGSRSSPYTLTQIDVPGAPGAAAAHGINDAGEIVGAFGDAAVHHGFLRSVDGSFLAFDAPEASVTEARGINSGGQIVGTYNNDPYRRAFLRNVDGSFLLIDVPWGYATLAHGINAEGKIAGSYRDEAGPHGVVFNPDGSPALILNIPDSRVIEARGINSAGHIVGSFEGPSGAHGFSLRPQPNGGYFYLQIDVPGALGTSAYGVNDADDIVGTFVDGTGAHGFVRKADGTLTPSFIAIDAPAATRTEAFGINASGNIAGLFVDAGGEHGFLATPPTVQLCDATNQDSCTSCTRSFAAGAQHVIFPNAHLWLSRSWNDAQAYYRARSCSSNLSTCVATFEGYIDATWLNPATARRVPPCLVQSFDTDTFRPLFYPGPARPLSDANFCFAGTVLSISYNVTTFFPNYRDIGACGALGPAAAASCAYTPAPAPPPPPPPPRKEDDD